MQKRKICFIITSKNHYARSKLILKELLSRSDVDLKIIVGASAILPNYGDVLSELKKDGFNCDAKITMTLEGGSPIAMAKTAGMGVTEFASLFENLSPDIVVVRGDRYEILSAAIAAAYLNIPVAHIEGGDVTGTIDESVRHAVTKLAHIHFTTNEDSKNRVIKMGENPKYVFSVGCPGLEVVLKSGYFISNEVISSSGVGDAVDIEKDFLIVMQHPVTSEIGENGRNARQTLEAVYELNVPTIVFWPNIDAGTDEISKEIRRFREFKKNSKVRFLKYLPTEEFIGLLKKSVCLVGNSSAGIKEASFMGVPVVNIGTRQQGRRQDENVFNVGYNKDQIKEAIVKQIEHGPFSPSSFYYKENTSKSIVDTLTSIELYTQKFFFE